MCLVKLSSCVRKTESKQSWATHAISFFSPSRRDFLTRKKINGRTALWVFLNFLNSTTHKKIFRLKIYKMRKANSLLRKENSHLSLVRSVEHCVFKCGRESYQLISEFSRQILLIIGVAGRLMCNRPKWMGSNLIEPKVRISWGKFDTSVKSIGKSALDACQSLKLAEKSHTLGNKCCLNYK